MGVKAGRHEENSEKLSQKDPLPGGVTVGF